MSTPSCLRALTLSLLLAPACVSAGATSEDDLADIEAAGAAWLAAANARDHAALAEVYAKEAVLMPPGAETVVGPDAIADYFEGYPPFEDLQIGRDEVRVLGNAGFVRGWFSMNLLQEGADPIPARGKFVEIWERQSDDTWKMAYGIFNSDTPPAGQ